MGAGAQTGIVNVDPHPAPSGAPHPLSRLSAAESPDVCPDLRDVIPARREGKGEGGVQPGPPPGRSPEQRGACASSATLGEGAGCRGRFTAMGLLGSQPAPGLRNKPTGSHPTDKPDLAERYESRGTSGRLSPPCLPHLRWLAGVS